MKSKIYKLLSILLTIIVVFTSCVVAVGVQANSGTDGKTKEYFVKMNATGGTGTEQSPFGDIGAAVVAAVNNNYTDGDTVIVTIIDDQAVAGSDTVNWGTFPENYSFALKVQTAAGSVAATVNLPAKTCFVGDIEFANININAGGAWPGRKVYFGGNNVKFGVDTILNTDYVAYGKESGNVDFSQQVVKLEGSLKSNPTYIYLSNESSGKVSRNGDITLKLNSANGVIAPSGNYGTTEFANNINLDLTNMASVKLQDFGEAGGWTIGGAVQMVCKENLTITNETLLTTYAPTGGVYKIINNTGLEELLEFVPGTAGKYKLVVDTDRFTISVKDSQGTDYPIQTIENEKYIVLPATGGGIFTVTAEKNPETKEYYVSADGKSGNSGTATEPFLTVADAVKAANQYGMTAKDTVIVTVKGTAQVNWGTVAAYSFKMTVKSETEGTQAAVAMADKTVLSGDTVFKDIKLTAKGLSFNDHDVTFDSGTEYAVEYPAFGTSSTPSTVDGQTVIYRGKVYAPYTKITNDSSGNKTYTDDVNITVDNAGAELGFYLKSNYGKTVYEENANLNIDIKSAKAVKFINVGGTIEHKGAIQIIYKQGFQLSGKDLITAANPAKGVYWIVNNSGYDNLLEFTDTVGKYKVTSEYDVIAVSTADSSEIMAKDGYLILDKPGEYIIRVDRPAITKDYYVSPDGITVTSDVRPETAGTKENPVKTIADATRLIAQDPLNALDIANVIVPTDKEVEWGSDAVNYSPTIVIQSSNMPNVATVVTSGGTVFTGNTEFKAIKLVQKNTNAGIGFGHYNVVIDENSAIESNYINIGAVTSPGTVTENQNIELYGKYTGMEFKLAPSYGNTIYNNKINITVDNPETALNIKLGARAATTTTYNGNIYINIKNAKTISFGNIAVDATVNVGGTVQLIVNKDVSVTQAVKTNFNEIQAGGGKWYITNYSSTPDLISFGNQIGTFNIKDNKKVYVRQYEVEKMDIFEGGMVTLDSGEYVISDEEIPYLNNDLHKMLYFRNSGHLQDLYVRAEVTPGETYRFEYSVWCTRYEDMQPIVRQNGDYRWTLAVPEIISEEAVDNYYKVVCEVTVPEDYAYPTAFFGVELFPFAEGYLFDVAVYNEADEQIMPNNNLHSGLDYWAVGYEFWGAIFTGDKGGTGLLEFNGNTKLKVVNFSVDVIQELINACSPDDGKWWEDSQIKKEEVYVAYADAVGGTLKDTEGNPIDKHKILLVSSDNTYTAVTDSKGNFTFKDDVLIGYYELYVETQKGKKIETGYATYIEEADVVTFELIISYNQLQAESNATNSQATDYETVVGGEDTEEIVPNGSLSGTVYTSLLETVPDLKIYLEGIGEIVTDKNGNFAFGNVPVGEYSLYTVLADGTKYEFRKVKIMENVKLKVKLKYDPVVPIDTQETDAGWIVWVIVASIIALAGIVLLAIFLIFKKKKA